MVVNIPYWEKIVVGKVGECVDCKAETFEVRRFSLKFSIY